MRPFKTVLLALGLGTLAVGCGREPDGNPEPGAHSTPVDGPGTTATPRGPSPAGEPAQAGINSAGRPADSSGGFVGPPRQQAPANEINSPPQSPPAPREN